ncbi:Zn(2)-C6 fungal-type DNA-binding domain [Penicillium roqueforti FM164]|uniref:Zn(2)-C6 fungal-type DNA-binding domain n=1 Tax=Penicillium roqueforti (strain FM164) TaxID=1365484 RepID=W6QK35_PENRF|nr:Zn(2)-C6 fungal-type DNA-binding domain [Penicillium roqueforti FM164]
MTPQPPSFQCHFPGCGLGYRRKEHLTRHAKSHFQSQSYECPFCDRVFARNDTLRQHVRTLHRNKELQSSRAVQACNYCRSRRSRCNGQTPCDTCFQRGIQCSYTQNSRRELKQTKNADGHMSSVASVEPGYPYSPAAEPSSVQRAETIEKCPSRIVPYVPYVEAYFKNFHPKWPFLHPATFDPDHEPAFLLQSVIMMGLWATGESNARQTAKDLHHKLTSSIYEQREKWDISNHYHESQLQQDETPSSEPSPWPMATYQGILLHLIFSLLLYHDHLDLRLTHALPEIPSQLLVALVRTCLKRKMFFYPSILTQFKPGVDPDVFIWLGIEEVKRFCLSLYRVCRQSRIHDPKLLEDAPSFSPGKSLLSLTDLQFALPDKGEFWHATSDLAARLAENPAAYSNENIEENWISQTAPLLQPCDAKFHWI